MLTLILCCVLSGPIQEAVDIFDPDGDSSISDHEFAAGYKTLLAIGKSKKKQGQELAEKFDLDGDGILSEDEALTVAVETRVSADFLMAKMMAERFRTADGDSDGSITKQELMAISNAQIFDRVKKGDANKDGTTTLAEWASSIDSIWGPEWRTDHHQSKRNPQLYSRAVQTIQRLGGTDRRINKLEAGKDKALHEKFDEIDADGDGRLKVIELFQWMISQ